MSLIISAKSDGVSFQKKTVSFRVRVNQAVIAIAVEVPVSLLGHCEGRTWKCWALKCNFAQHLPTRIIFRSSGLYLPYHLERSRHISYLPSGWPLQRWVIFMKTVFIDWKAFSMMCQEIIPHYCQERLPEASSTWVTLKTFELEHWVGACTWPLLKAHFQFYYSRGIIFVIWNSSKCPASLRFPNHFGSMWSVWKPKFHLHLDFCIETFFSLKFRNSWE